MRTSRHMFLACVNKGVSGKREHDCLNTNKTSSILPFQAVSSKVFVTLQLIQSQLILNYNIPSQTLLVVGVAFH